MTVGYERSIVGDILHRFKAGPRLIQVVTGPRQVGKTTAARQIERRWSGPVQFASADISPPPGPEWIRSHWVQARRKAGSGPAMLVLDEVQKIAGWGDEVRFSRGQARSRGSSPKLVLWSNALVSALSSPTFDQARADPSWWGRLVENAVGAHLVSGLRSLPHEVAYWRERDEEVDYVVQTSGMLWAIEVKSGRERRASGLARFLRRYPDARPLIVGSGGMDLEEFFGHDPRSLLE